MFRKKYYCLVAGLPDLFFNENKLIRSSLEFREELKNHIHISDYELVKILFLKHDNDNILNLVFETGDPFDTRGNFTREMLENPLLFSGILPSYLVLFSKWIKMQEPGILNLETKNKLQTLYYEQVLNTGNSFLSQWLLFELNIKNILAAVNCERFHYSQKNQLIKVKQGELVYSLLLHRRFKPEYFEEILPHAGQVFRIAESGSNPEEKEKAIDKLRWNYVDELTCFHYFTIEKILAQVIKLEITERWIKLDFETGKAFLNKLTDELKQSFTFPEEFDAKMKNYEYKG